VASDRLVRPDWRDASGYAWLDNADPAAFAWEWLRRDPLYRAAAGGVPERRRETSPRILPADPEAARWGLHAFEDPALPARAARPVWRRDWLRRVLVADARVGGPGDDRLDLARFADLATVVSAGGPEHLLLSDGTASLRLDLLSGSLLAGPACLVYRLAGLAALHGPLDTLRALVRLWQSGRLGPFSPSSRNRRLVLLLRAGDALRDGAAQREIAAGLLSGDAAGVRWRSAAPSLRSRAQRLVKGARLLAAGDWRKLLDA